MTDKFQLDNSQAINFLNITPAQWVGLVSALVAISGENFLILSPEELDQVDGQQVLIERSSNNFVKISLLPGIYPS